MPSPSSFRSAEPSAHRGPGIGARGELAAMGMRIRMGPVSLSSRGRVGVHAGPVSFYGGGRRRSGSGDGAAAFGVLLLIALVIAAVQWAIAHWYFALPALAAISYVGYLVLQAERKRQER